MAGFENGHIFDAVVAVPKLTSRASPQDLNCYWMTPRTTRFFRAQAAYSCIHIVLPVSDILQSSSPTEQQKRHRGLEHG